MPYIKKIRLKNFKMFGGPRFTEITLDRGFIVFTGPNGSGKTNIVDAILFGLGELSPRRLRAESFAKLIFHGSPEAGMRGAQSAKVVIQFDNSDRRIPINADTITVSREVYRNGQSVYRLNGKKTSRSRIVDLLSVAGISATGHNIVLQGTITRMAELSSVERRRLIEDMVGLAQYDTERMEAEEKLREADISIRTVMGRIDEVQRRLDALERERNDLLRYNFIQNEIKRYQALQLSHEIHESMRRVERISSQIDEAKRRVEELRGLRDKLRAQRQEVEREWRKLSSEIMERGETQVLETQIKIGEVKSRISELTVKIGAETTTLEGLRKVRENNAQRLEAIRREIMENRREVRRLRRRMKLLLKDLSEKQARHDALAKEATQFWSNLSENSKMLREIEQRLSQLYQDQAALQEERARAQVVTQNLQRQLKELNERKRRLEQTLTELQKSYQDLEEVQKEQRDQLKSLKEALERRKSQKLSLIHI